jgi:hypothetical protein
MTIRSLQRHEVFELKRKLKTAILAAVKETLDKALTDRMLTIGYIPLPDVLNSFDVMAAEEETSPYLCLEISETGLHISSNHAEFIL